MKPLNIAHRGASGEAPENTMKAFQKALDAGADGIEFDIFLTSDKKMVVTHDENLKGLTGHNIETRKSTLAKLRELDFGDGEKIPTLDGVLESFGKRFTILNIEIKSTGYLTDGVETKLLEHLQRHHVEEKTIVSSFNPFNLMRMKRIAPHIRRGYLIWPEHWTARRKFFIRLAGVESVNLDYRWATDHRLDRYRKMGKKIWVWTVNDAGDMKKWVDKGVEAIITNHPARLKQLLR